MGSDNQQNINEAFKGRDLLITLKALIFDLVGLEKDMAVLDVSNVGASISQAKRVLLQHGKNINDLKKRIDAIRIETMKERGTKSIFAKIRKSNIKL